jgi:rare lipoprotein A (peptidoglycan hydrolase)
LITFRNPANGRTLTLPVVDRGPYVSGRQWDLTGGACLALRHCYTGAFQWKYGRS